MGNRAGDRTHGACHVAAFRFTFSFITFFFNVGFIMDDTTGRSSWTQDNKEQFLALARGGWMCVTGTRVPMMSREECLEKNHKTWARGPKTHPEVWKHNLDELQAYLLQGKREKGCTI